MFWDYFYSEESIPDRSGQEFEGINVVSPSFFILDNNGDIKTNIAVSYTHLNSSKLFKRFRNLWNSTIIYRRSNRNKSVSYTHLFLIME